MHLITMAHLGEAQALIDKFRLQKVSNGLFQGPEFNLLLTGEGPFEASSQTSFELGRNTYSRVINIGIAGSLADLPAKSVHQVRSIYLVSNGKPLYKSFSSHSSGMDLITSFERILNEEKVSPLRGVAKLVDREAWGVAFACKSASIPFEAWKIVSDEAGKIDACEVRNESEEFSLIIAKKVEEILQVSSSATSEFIDIEGFWATHSTRIQLTQGIKTISLREEMTIKKVIASLPIKELKDQKLLPKDRTKKLLKTIEYRLDPLRENIENALLRWKRPVTDDGIQLIVDSGLENTNVKINFDASNALELNHKLETLKKIDFNRLEKIRQGDFHVE